MSGYIVQAVGDEELPEGIHAAIVERDGLPAVLFINGEVARCWHMLRAWAIETPTPADVPSVELRGERLRAV
ncbi:hypothetical protein [uncultured Arthrobacter sp.]|uniref:hypothetical protein n=1 Tax=uncultured Arthrobacter sp. TaxID=114050 RepID=UPI0025E1F834|nr:hypothetical protein [uncultured Arthrobacter sp.]